MKLINYQVNKSMMYGMLYDTCWELTPHIPPAAIVSVSSRYLAAYLLSKDH